MSAFHWPASVRKRAVLQANLQSVSGGVSLGGREALTRSDDGFWSLRVTAFAGTMNAYSALRALFALLRGRQNVVIMPLCDHGGGPDFRAWRNQYLTDGQTHLFAATFSDGTGYRQQTAECRADAALAGASLMTLRFRPPFVSPFAGQIFSIADRLYQVETAQKVSGDASNEVWSVRFWPPLREDVRQSKIVYWGAATGLFRLADESQMGIGAGERFGEPVNLDMIEAFDR